MKIEQTTQVQYDDVDTDLWLFFDLSKKRITKIPSSVSEPYTAEAQDVLGAGAIDFTVDKTVDSQEAMTITTREGNLDPNCHVNNATYLDYPDTLIRRSTLPTGMGDPAGNPVLQGDRTGCAQNPQTRSGFFPRPPPRFFYLTVLRNGTHAQAQHLQYSDNWVR